MLTRWLTFTAFLAGSVNPERAATGQGTVSVAPTRRVKGHPEVELTLNCGDGKKAGVVQFWHTPVGDLQTSGFHSKLDPVFMHQDGSLVVPNASILHSGLYYCLLQHTEGTTLWPYELHVSQNNQKNREHREHERHSSRGAFRFRRDDVGSEEEGQAASDGQFAGAVAASVLLTFVVGFSAGALTRTHVLRCLGAVTTRLRSPRQQQRQTDTANYDSEVTMTTLPPSYHRHTFDTEQVTGSLTTSSPPAKPQRSFQKKRQEEQGTTAYLEGCDYMEEEEEEAAAGGSLEEKSKGCDGEAEQEREFSGFYLLGEDGGSQTETDEEDDGGESREEKKEWRQEEEVEEAGEQEDGEEGRGSEEVAGSNKEKDEMREDEKEGDNREKRRREEDGETDDETGSTIEGEPASPPPRPGRRVIRLYQYDEDGQRYCHLPDPVPNEPGPAPRLKQRSVSLSRLNGIMAAASAGPLGTRDREGGEGGEATLPHGDITETTGGR